MLVDQADSAVDNLELAAQLIANSPDEDESDDLDEIDGEAPPEEDGEDSSDAEKEGATDAPKREVTFAGQKFEIPEGTPDEVAVKVEEIGKNLQADYTRKTQDLVSREKQAAEIVQSELNQGKQHIQQALTQAQAIIQAIGGFMGPDEMARLAQEDPQAWIAQNARQGQVNALIDQLSTQAQAVVQQAQQAEMMRQEAAKQEAWQRLSEEGINREGLQKMWGEAKQAYPFITDERLSQVLDAESWLVLRDAIAYRQLKAKAPAATKAAALAPKLPESRKPMSKDDRSRLDARKAVQKKGGASLRDLAAFIETNKR
jgi:hypothetical protein